MQSIAEQSVYKTINKFGDDYYFINNTENKCMRGVRVFFFCYARMCSGNSVRLNKTKIRWKGIFLEVCVVFNLSQISVL